MRRWRSKARWRCARHFDGIARVARKPPGPVRAARPWSTAPQAEPWRRTPSTPCPSATKTAAATSFVRLRPGETVAPLAVLASASDEPDYGMDLNLWEDNPRPGARAMALARFRSATPTSRSPPRRPSTWASSTSRPSSTWRRVSLKRTYPLLRIQQYRGLSELAFRSGHPYWGWRFAGLALHYVRDLTQPYHASLAPGFRRHAAHRHQPAVLLGMPGAKNDMVILLSNRHFVLERYESQMIQAAAQTRQASSVERPCTTPAPMQATRVVRPVHRDTVARQAHDLGVTVTDQMLATVPVGYVNDPGFDFGLHAKDIDLMAEVARQGEAPRAALESTIATLMRNAGQYSRNLVRGILQDRSRAENACHPRQ